MSGQVRLGSRGKACRDTGERLVGTQVPLLFKAANKTRA